MKHRSAPRPFSVALGGLVDAVEPLTPLGRLQRAWPAAVGAAVAAHATPTSFASGTVVVTCESAVWAQELDLLQGELVPRLSTAVPDVDIRALRCRAAASGSWSRSG